jgi:coenzyme F420-reducing hydrogenase delta subunit
MFAMQQSIYGFADEVGSLPMKLQKIERILPRNCFGLFQIGLASKLHCYRASQ